MFSLHVLLQPDLCRKVWTGVKNKWDDSTHAAIGTSYTSEAFGLTPPVGYPTTAAVVGFTLEVGGVLSRSAGN